MDYLNQYAQAMKKFYNLYAVWTPERASRIKPGMCGYFDSQGDWNLIANILEIQDGNKLTKLASAPVVQEKAQEKWEPMASDGVKWKRVHLAVPASMPETNIKFQFGLDFESSEDYSAVLLTGPQVLGKFIENPKSIFHSWCLQNYASITEQFPDVKQHGLWVVTKAFETPRCAISSWSGKQASSSLYLGAGAFVGNSLTLNGAVGERDNSALWRFFSVGQADNILDSLVVFVGGLRYKDSWFGPKQVPVAAPLRGEDVVENFTINRRGELVEVICEVWGA